MWGSVRPPHPAAPGPEGAGQRPEGAGQRPEARCPRETEPPGRRVPPAVAGCLDIPRGSKAALYGPEPQGLTATEDVESFLRFYLFERDGE